MTSYRREASFPQRLLIVGTGCVSQGFLPLLLRHVAIPPEKVTLLGPDIEGRRLASCYGVNFLQCKLTPENYAGQLSAQLTGGDFLINLALGVGSLDLLAWCQAQDVLYLDTTLEPWSSSTLRLYEAREAALRGRRAGGSTAVIAHGANPGLVSHFLKRALCEMASAKSLAMPAVLAREWWARVAGKLGVRVILVAEHDSHVSRIPRCDDEFANTWSALGFAEELCQPAELAWGTHEIELPLASHSVEALGGRILVFDRPAGSTLVRSWTAGAGELNGFLIGHHEVISMSDLLSADEGDGRPTVFYAYRPCPDACRSAQELRHRRWIPQPKMRVMKAELEEGSNELGVLILGTEGGYWYGSQLGLARARELVSDTNATSLQVAAGVLGGMVWAIENPRAGVVEAEDMDFGRVLAVASPYLGGLGGVHTDWRPVGDIPREAALRFGVFLIE